MMMIIFYLSVISNRNPSTGPPIDYDANGKVIYTDELKAALKDYSIKNYQNIPSKIRPFFT